MTTNLRELSDAALNLETKRVAQVERATTVELLLLLNEVERRTLHLALGCSSMFLYCTRALLLSEQAAYSRIAAARAARRWPRILEMLTSGALTLSSVGRLAPQLVDENADLLLDAAAFKSTRDVEQMIAGTDPKPDVPMSLRALPVTALPASTGQPLLVAASSGPTMKHSQLDAAEPASRVVAVLTVPASVATSQRAVIAPLSPRRYLLKVTVLEDTQLKLERARTLLRHAIPDGDIDVILNRALGLLLDRVTRQRFAATKEKRPCGMTASRPARGRHIPAGVKREVWDRDRGRCVFSGSDGLCGETGFLEYHHRTPFAAGGPATVENLELRCRAHNAYEEHVRDNH